MNWRRIDFIGMLLLLAVVVLPIMGQDDSQSDGTPPGRGVIIETNLEGVSLASLNPLRCTSETCERITGMLYPSVYALDPATGQPVPAAAENYGLAVEVQAPEENIHILRLREDLTWSDGTPITAYDVFYSYAANFVDIQLLTSYAGVVRAEIAAVRPLDAYTLEIAYRDPDCDVLLDSNIPVVPAHVYGMDFQEEVQRFEGDDNIYAWFEAWLEDANRSDDFLRMSVTAVNSTPQATAGPLMFAERSPDEVRFRLGQDGRQAFILPSDWRNDVDAFLDGETNILFNPPYTHWQDLRATADLQIVEYVGPRWDAIVLNTASRVGPRSAFAENGALLDQGHHPIFGDVRVRQAMQKAIDVNTLIEAAFLGNATPLAANQLPHSWAFNPDLAPVPYNIREAEQLLYDAGWKDQNGDGIRECAGCLYAPEGTPLSFELYFTEFEQSRVVTEFIRRQLRQVGMDVFLIPVNNAEWWYQDFDAFLRTFTEPTPVSPDQTALFTRAGDVVGSGGNYGSYYHPDVERLMEEARVLPGCDLNARAELYREIQAILQEDQPYIWLYAPHEMIVAQGGVLGFDPYPFNPYWNIQEWVVVE